MPLVYNPTVKETAEKTSDIATRLLALVDEWNGLLAHNSANSIDWGGDPKPAYITESVDGNLDGLSYDRASVSNAIGSFDAINTLLGQGHRGNLEKIAKADR